MIFAVMIRGDFFVRCLHNDHKLHNTNLSKKRIVIFAENYEDDTP